MEIKQITSDNFDPNKAYWCCYASFLKKRFASYQEPILVKLNQKGVDNFNERKTVSPSIIDYFTMDYGWSSNCEVLSDWPKAKTNSFKTASRQVYFEDMCETREEAIEKWNQILENLKQPFLTYIKKLDDAKKII